jgi:valyl-tRNA synthetase
MFRLLSQNMRNRKNNYSAFHLPAFNSLSAFKQKAEAFFLPRKSETCWLPRANALQIFLFKKQKTCNNINNMANKSKELPKSYNFKEVEDKIYKLWEKGGFFSPDKIKKIKSKIITKRSEFKKSKTAFTIVMPPPNITGSLHMGHALNTVIQDILIRKKRMEGFQALWIPGTDHAGIATQNVVEKELKKEGLTRFDLGREKFLEKIWQWKKKYGSRILEQLKKMGASCDWSKERFTMDKDYQKTVNEAFAHYYKKGLIYRAERVINWCPRCQTSLSDLELEYKKEAGKLWFIKYELKTRNSKLKIAAEGLKPNGQTASYITVATTRPETMLGDSAVAVNPNDKRYKNLIGQNAILPLVGRIIPVIADRRINQNFGTGAVKITPSHDMLDAEIGKTHNLPAYKVIGENGKITIENKYKGLNILEARNKIIEDLKKQNLIEKIEEYDHNIAKCYRCNSTIEILPSLQWFLKMNNLAKKAIGAVKSKKVKFYPKRWEKIYLNWLKNVKDWNISRQLWWGHKIPLKNEGDVLDTWFSSALWPFAVFNKKSDLKKFYPTNTLVTARDIINLWVARMVFSGIEFTKKEPFKDVVIHATILTKEGKRMSKSLGTGIDPMDLIEQYGADATRFALIWQAMGNQDIHWDETSLLAGKKFLNKIWNATRFIAQNEKFKLQNSNLKIKNLKPLTKDDKKILKELNNIIKNANKHIENYEFGHALHKLYDFFWHDFCDKYLEVSKSQMRNPKLQKNTQQILLRVLTASLKLLHPFLPFITEEIWSSFFKVRKNNLLIIENWPHSEF